MKNSQSDLPPGFRFHPTDEELILHYLRKKVAFSPFPVSFITDVDIYKFDPWELPEKAPFGEKEWYFFSPRDRKYPNGARPNRAAASGYWKATGTDKVIVTSSPGSMGGRVQENIGVKKALVFYQGRPPRGTKTNWIMHEYRLTDALNYHCKGSTSRDRPVRSKDSSMRLDEWVLCRIYKKAQASSSSPDQEEEDVPNQEIFSPMKSKLISQRDNSLTDLFEAVDYSFLNSFLSENPDYQSEFEIALNSHSTILDQPIFSINSSTSSSNNSFLANKLPQMTSLGSNMNNNLKRQNPNSDEDFLNNPSKKITSSCSFNNSINHYDNPYQYSSYANQSFMNQQLLKPVINEPPVPTRFSHSVSRVN